jgi:formate dehydrogenase iron-sulfur subunit
MSKAMLIDTTRCIGCRGCQVACKSWNDLEAAPSGFSPTGTNPQHLDANTYTRVLFRDLVLADGRLKSVYVKRQCMHCAEPACASSCPVGALQKTKAGPVTYDESKCIGCRYCMVACPFNVPKFQWAQSSPCIRKCTFCEDRQAVGQAPACVTTCPSEAISFGDRDELLREAHRRIDANPGKYVSSVYGETTGGGTSVLYLTALPIEALGLEKEGFPTNLGEVAQARASRRWVGNVPALALAVGGVALGLYHYNQRRAEIEDKEGTGS